MTFVVTLTNCGVQGTGPLEDMSLRLEVDQPIPEQIEPPTPGTLDKIRQYWTQTQLGPSESPTFKDEFFKKHVEGFSKIKVRMFPILTTPYQDPYRITKNTKNFLITSPIPFNIVQVEDAKNLGNFQTAFFDFSAHTMLLDNVSYPLTQIFIVPIDTAGSTHSILTMMWDNPQWSFLKKKSKKKSSIARQQLASKAVSLSTNPAKGSTAVKVRGILKILPTPYKLKDQNPIHWSVINILDINDYLLSVVPSEVYISWEIEALKAQAIAARSYALNMMARQRELSQREWDVDPTTWYQSYRGVQFKGPTSSQWLIIERDPTSRAVNEAPSQVVAFQGEVIAAYFSANSGGITCSAQECFGTSENPDYLVAVPDADGVKEVGATGTWGDQAVITPNAIKERLKKLGYTGDFIVERLKQAERGPSGRTWRLKVIFRNRSPIILDRTATKSMLSMFGPIRSHLFELFSPPSTSGFQKVTGHGYGHGVGLSQWGAQLFALQGKSASEILLHYYSHTSIEHLW